MRLLPYVVALADRLNRLAAIKNSIGGKHAFTGS
jgi:hypothetical protein